MGKKALDFVFINPYSQHDYYSVQMAKHVKGEVTIKNVADMVRHVLLEISRTGQKIGSMTFVGHASPGDFFIGEENVGQMTLFLSRVGGKPQTPHAIELGKLTVHFAPDACVRILQCKTAGYDAGMALLSILWPGVKIIGWTGDIMAYEDDYETEGRMVTCTMGSCSKSTTLGSSAIVGI